MDRIKSLSPLWRHLPAFRAVAEQQNLTRAARMMGLTPPALTYAVQALEKHIGVKLFVRESRGLQLTLAGHDFLEVVREAMRHIDDARQSLTQKPEMTPALRIAVTDLESGWLLYAAALELSSTLRFEAHACRPEEISVRLLSGQLDMVIGFQGQIDHRLIVRSIGPVERGCYSRSLRPTKTISASAWEEARYDAVDMKLPIGVAPLPFELLRVARVDIPDVLTKSCSPRLIRLADAEKQTLFRMTRTRAGSAALRVEAALKKLLG